jgi:hypothetical protein
MKATTLEKRLRRNVAKNQLLSRELDFLPSNVSRDSVREIARRYGPLRRRSTLSHGILGIVDFLARYSSPFVGMIIGAEYAAARALFPLMGEEKQFGDALRLYLGENLGQRVADTTNAFKVTGTLVAATPDIIFSALYGAVIGIAAYFVLKWFLMFGVWQRRRSKLNRKLSQLLG